MTAGRCPSCGRELGDLVSTTYKDPVVIIRYEVVGDDGEITEMEHLCGGDGRD